MKRRTKIHLLTLLMVTSCVSIFSVGYAAWHVTAEMPKVNTEVTFNSSTIVNAGSGIAIEESNEKVKISVYFFEVNNNNTDKFEYTYTLKVTPNELDPGLRTTSGSGYQVTINTFVKLFNSKNSTYLNAFTPEKSSLYSVSSDSANISFGTITNKTSEANFSITFTTSNTSNTIDSYSLKLTYDRTLIDYLKADMNSTSATIDQYAFIIGVY